MQQSEQSFHLFCALAMTSLLLLTFCLSPCWQLSFFPLFCQLRLSNLEFIDLEYVSEQVYAQDSGDSVIELLFSSETFTISGAESLQRVFSSICGLR